MRGVPMFSPLSGPVLERLTAGAERLTVPRNADVIRQGDPDRFYIVVAGHVGVTVSDRDAGELGPGDGSERSRCCAMSREAPPSMPPKGILAIQRGPLLEALTGQPRSRAVAGDVVQGRLAADRTAASDG